MTTTLKIGIFIISVPDDLLIKNNDLPNYEFDIKALQDRFAFSKNSLKEIYLDGHNTSFSLNYHFLACDQNNFNPDKWEDECMDCKESYFTGIYEKTYRAFQHYKNYDFYIRTNLSTYVSHIKLYQKLKDLDTEKPILTGTKWVNKHFKQKWGEDFVYASGNSIIMNKLARDFFVQEGAACIGLRQADDALITKIFYDAGNPFYFHKGLSNSHYCWDWDQSLNFNLDNIIKKKSIFVKLKENQDPTKFKYTLNILRKLK